MSEQFTKEEIEFAESAFVKVIPVKPRVLRGIGFQTFGNYEMTPELAEILEAATKVAPEAIEAKREASEKKDIAKEGTKRPRLTPEEKAKRLQSKEEDRLAREHEKWVRAQKGDGTAPSFFPTHDRERVAHLAAMPGKVAGSCKEQGGVTMKVIEALDATVHALILELSELEADMIEWQDVMDCNEPANQAVLANNAKSYSLLENRRNAAADAVIRIGKAMIESDYRDPGSLEPESVDNKWTAVQKEVAYLWAKMGKKEEFFSYLIGGGGFGSFGPDVVRPDELL